MLHVVPINGIDRAVRPALQIDGDIFRVRAEEHVASGMNSVVAGPERLVDQPTAHSEDEIFQRIAADLTRRPDAVAPEPWLCFRLIFLEREGDAIVREELFRAAPRRRADIVVR